MEIQRKFLLTQMPDNLDSYPHHDVEQFYLCYQPIIRARRTDNSYALTYNSEGNMIREEASLPLTAEGFAHLRAKADQYVIHKTRYDIPLECGHTCQLDVFKGRLEGLRFAEIKFDSEEDANAFTAPAWMGEEVTHEDCYHNRFLATVEKFYPE